MNRTIQNTKKQLLVAMAGSALTMLLWRLSAPLLHQYVNASSLELINSLAILSLTIAPLTVIGFSKERVRDYGFCSKDLFRQIVTGMVIGLAMASVLTLLPMLLGLKKLVYTGEIYTSFNVAIKKLLFFVFVVGLTEEFVFRGFIFCKLKEICLTDEAPILISSLMFGLYHFSGFNFTQVLTTGLIGAFFCLCKERIPNCTLLSLAIAHGIHDWLIRIIAGWF